MDTSYLRFQKVDNIPSLPCSQMWSLFLPSSPPILPGNTTKFLKKDITWLTNTGNFPGRAYIWNVKDVSIDHVSKGDRNTDSKEVGTSLKCPFPLSSEPQHLAWLDPCQQRCPSALSRQNWSAGVGQAMEVGPLRAQRHQSLWLQLGVWRWACPTPLGLETVWGKWRGDISPHCEFSEGQVYVFPCNTNTITDNNNSQHCLIRSCQVRC